MFLMKLSKIADVLCGSQSYTVVILWVLSLQALRTEGSDPTVVLDVEPAVERQRLRTDLLKNYSRNRRPVINQTTKLKLNVFYEVQHIFGLDEQNQILSVNGQLALLWTDQFLTWDPNMYSGIAAIRFSPEEVWLPELQSFYNVRQVKIYDKTRSPPVYATSNGSMQWYPKVRYDVPCSADYRHYPFDSHKCFLLIANHAFDAYDTILSTDWQPLNQSSSVRGTEWALKGVSHAVEFIDQKYPYYQVNISLHLERMSRMYRYVCVVPTLISMVTLLCGFWLLPNEAARYVIGYVNVIVLSMLLQHLAVTVPAGRVVPLIAQYSASCLCLSAVFIIVTVVSNLLRESNGTAPSALVRLTHLSLQRYLCIFTFSHVSSQELISEATPPESVATPPDELKRRKDWYTVSVLVDRLAFCCFALIFVALLTVLAVV